ncbi:MAG: MarR family transcriptional regulator [Chloroflexota bacterium]
MDPQTLHERLREVVVYLEAEDYRLLAPFDLEPVEYSALQILDTVPGLRMGDLRDRLLVDKSKVTRVVDHLAARGWVTRQPDQNDRRAARVVLTPEGKAYRDSVTAERAGTLPGRFAVLDPGEQQTLEHLLNRLRDHLVERTQTPEETHHG